MRQLASNAIKTYDETIVQAEKKKEDVQAEKKKELDDITAEIERLQQVRHDQIVQIMTQIGEYILIFIVIYLTKIFSLRLVRKFGI